MGTRGFTLVEIVILGLMMAVLAAVVVLLAPTPQVHVHVESELKVDAKKMARELMQEARKAVEDSGGAFGSFEANKTECMSNVRNLVGLLATGDGIPTKWGGPNLLLWLVRKGELEGEHSIRLLFCPGDTQESFEDVGLEAYKGLDLGKQGQYGHLTSYAARDQTKKHCRIDPRSAKQFVLVCDDSQDHHDNKGFVIGLTGGAAKFRHKVDDWEISIKAVVTVGERSLVKELECLAAD